MSVRRFNRTLLGWQTLGTLAFVLLPWYLPQDSGWWASLADVFSPGESSSGLIHSVVQGRPWLFCAPLALVIGALAGALGQGRAQGRILLAASLLGLLGVMGAGFAIGARGWSFEFLQSTFGALPNGQAGIGLGGAMVLTSLLVMLGAALAKWAIFAVTCLSRPQWFCVVHFCCCSLCCRLARSLSLRFLIRMARSRSPSSSIASAIRESGDWVVFVGQSSCGVAWKHLFLAVLTATGTTLLGAMLALLAERGPARWRRPLNVLSLLPIITPPFVVGLGTDIAVRQGRNCQSIARVGIWRGRRRRWFYGMTGVLLAQLFAFTPIAFMIMRGVVQGLSPALEEAAQTLRASRARTFYTVTLPLLKPGLANTFLVGFIESMADFGNPIIVGGQYSVLSTEIFFAIVGAQLDQGRAASLALILTLFALLAFVAQQRLLGRNSYITVSGKGAGGIAVQLPDGLRRLCYSVALPWIGFTIVLYVIAFAGGFVKIWGRDYTPTLAHLSTAFGLQWSEHGLVWVGSAWNSLFTTVQLAAIAAPLCAGLGLLMAWLIARTQFAGKAAFEFGALLAFAIPGTVLGVSYILAFNVPPLELTGTALIIVLCFVFRNLPVGVRAGSANLGQLDRSLDEASIMLRASTATTLRRVLLPLLKPALAAALVYSFVRSMTTVSAVIFLVTAEHELATTYIIGRVSNGEYGVALAYCTVLIGMMLVVTLGIQKLVGERQLGKREP